jgi:hypothetical protein
MKRFYGEHFDSLGATLEIQGGQARTADFSLVTPYYEFGLRGLIRLSDLGLDAEGELALGEELTAGIAGWFGLKKMPLVQKRRDPDSDAGGYAQRSRAGARLPVPVAGDRRQPPGRRSAEAAAARCQSLAAR